MAAKKKTMFTPRQEERILELMKEDKTPAEVAQILKLEKKDEVKRFMVGKLLEEKGWSTGARVTQPKVDGFGALKLSKSFLKNLGFEFEKNQTFNWSFDEDKPSVTIILDPVKPK